VIVFSIRVLDYNLTPFSLLQKHSTVLSVSLYHTLDYAKSLGVLKIHNFIHYIAFPTLELCEQISGYNRSHS